MADRPGGKKKRVSWGVRLWGLSLLALAVLVALPSLRFALGHDQSISFHIAKEWWQQNLIPYRDIVDSRAPGVHFINLMAGFLFGWHPYSIWIFQIIVAIAGGRAVAQAAAHRRLSLVELGPIVLLWVGYYFTSVGSLDSGQADFWAATCLVAGQAMIAVDKNRRRASIVAGLWSGCAAVIEPQMIFILPILFTQLFVMAMAERAEPEKLPTIVDICAAFFLGFIQPPAAFAGYFATRNGYSQLLECTRPLLFQGRPAAAALTAWIAATWPVWVSAGALWAVGLVQRLRKPPPRQLWMSALGPVFLIGALPVLWTQKTFDGGHGAMLLLLLTLAAADGLLALGKIWKPLPTLVAVFVVALRCFSGSYYLR